MNEFPISQANTVYWQTDNDGLAVYVIAKHPDGWTMRIDAPTQLNGEWLSKSDRIKWAKFKVRKAKELMNVEGSE